ncbi:hypothetical protein DPX16_21091 [Anabarilius grahami]|uniref:Uncharacterized protein n=1 Tax=Anabarilius grahami TaxID=495550 RepID=A0A3N0Z9H1_ANAGA|nr:hypothetical protein DPX16_21091 [Anabarilius grahami]
MRTLRSRLSIFLREEGQTSVPGGSGPSRAWRFKWWGSQVELAERFEKGATVSCDSAAHESDLLDEDAIFLASSGSADSALLAPSQDEEQSMAEAGSESVRSEPSRPSCPAYEELLDVMGRASDRLKLSWERIQEETVRGRLDKRFLSDHRRSIPSRSPF